MFTMLPAPIHTPKPLHHYTPHHPSPLSSSPLRSSPPVSPLSPRSTNVPSRSSVTIPSCSLTPIFSPTPDICHKAAHRPVHVSRESPYSKRIIKSNPLLHGRNEDDGRETRRKLFLKKVREDSEEHKWRARGGEDEMMRTIWIAEQRRRAERQARDAMGWVDLDLVEEDLDMDRNRDELMADEVAKTEQEEMEALISLMTESKRIKSMPAAHSDDAPMDQDIRSSSWISARGGNVPISPVDSQMSDTSDLGAFENYDHFMDTQRKLNTHSPETTYGSDDGIYDDIFMDVIQEENRIASQRMVGASDHDMDMDMDMS